MELKYAERKPILLKPFQYSLVKPIEEHLLLRVKSKPAMKCIIITKGDHKIKLKRSISAPTLKAKTPKEPVWRARGGNKRQRESTTAQLMTIVINPRTTHDADWHLSENNTSASSSTSVTQRSVRTKPKSLNYFRTLTEKEIKKKLKNKFSKYIDKTAKNGEEISQPLKIEAKDWFMHIVGCTEKEFRLKKDLILSFSETSMHGLTRNTILLKNIQTNQVSSAGELKQYKFEDIFFEVLRTQFSSSYKNGNHVVPFEIMTRQNASSPSRFVDVAYLQALPENRDAVFQVASNFNGVEPINEDFHPSQSDFTEKYYLDATQGPAASVATGPAAIARVHAPFADRSKPVTEWAQTKTKQLNSLENIKEHFPVTNGYVTLNGEEPAFPEPNSFEYLQLMWKTSVCYHRRCQVTTGHRTQNILEKLDHDFSNTVDQVLCAAININQGLNGLINQRIKDVEAKCRFILELAYHATYLTAMVNHRNHIFLTLVGGGAFGNKKEWIYDAILSAHRRWGTHPSSLRLVTLVLFKSSDLYKAGLDNFSKAGIDYTITYTDEFPEKSLSDYKL